MAKGDDGQMTLDELFDPNRGREKLDKGGVDEPGYAKVPQKDYDDDANYSRPETRPSPYRWLWEY
jgi:hypothetical protein